MAVDYAGRTRYRCSWKDCPYPAKVIDLTAGGFVEDGDKLFHGSCYEDKQGARTERAEARRRREADEALEKERIDALTPPVVTQPIAPTPAPVPTPLPA